jgi:hypothetical protein
MSLAVVLSARFSQNLRRTCGIVCHHGDAIGFRVNATSTPQSGTISTRLPAKLRHREPAGMANIAFRFLWYLTNVPSTPKPVSDDEWRKTHEQEP